MKPVRSEVKGVRETMSRMLLSLVLLLTGCAGVADMSPLSGGSQYVFTNGHSEDEGAGEEPGQPRHRSGLHARLIPVIVVKAHVAGLQVTAHVATATDFRHAVRAGVDEIAHVPGWLVKSARDAEQGKLTEDDARLAAERKVRVVTTAGAGRGMPSIVGYHPHGHHEGYIAGRSDQHAVAPNESWSQVLKNNMALLHRVGRDKNAIDDHCPNM